jgi:hypothetical protein
MKNYLIVTVAPDPPPPPGAIMGGQAQEEEGASMDTREGRDHLEVLRDPEAAGPLPSGAVPSPPDNAPETEPTAAAERTDEPEEYGLRVVWQSEAVKIEAAEFLVATRVQEASRRRLARATARLRDQLRVDRS